MNSTKKPVKNSSCAEKGASLLELMVTVGLLVFVIAGLYTSFIGSIMLNGSSADSIKAVNDASLVLEQMKGLSYSALGSYTPPPLNSLSNETVSVQRNAGLRITEVTVNVTWTERSRPRSLALKTRFVR